VGEKDHAITFPSNPYPRKRENRQKQLVARYVELNAISELFFGKESNTGAKFDRDKTIGEEKVGVKIGGR